VEARESMRFQATHDILTSLWNRGVIVELGSREVVRRAAGKIVQCRDDVRYRSFQEGEATRTGMPRGDVFARGGTAAANVGALLRHGRRYGGGRKFLVVLNKCDPSSAVARAENLRNIVAAKPILLSTKS